MDGSNWEVEITNYSTSKFSFFHINFVEVQEMDLLQHNSIICVMEKDPLLSLSKLHLEHSLVGILRFHGISQMGTKLIKDVSYLHSLEIQEMILPPSLTFWLENMEFIIAVVMDLLLEEDMIYVSKKWW